MQNIEEKIVELRMAEAIQKDLFGQTGKISIISKVFGSEIIQDNFSTNPIGFIYDDIEEEKVPEFDIGHTSYVIGYHFDGLRLGIQLEIIQKDYDNSLKVFWQNRVVYEESDGELISYNPLDEWEKNIDNLYKKAEKKIGKEKKDNKEIIDEQMKKEEDKEVARLKEKWGIF